ncbi:MAG: TonB family protein, partial [Xenococcaceae cyanobacterium]
MGLTFMLNNSIAGTRSKKLLHSNPIAIATSVVLHGLVFYFGLPNLMSDPLEDNSSIDLSRSVPTIELTPTEQNRLPDFSNALAGLPILQGTTPNLPQPPGLPPLPPIPPLPSAIAPNSNSIDPTFLPPLPPSLSAIPLPPPPPLTPLPAEPLSIKLPPPPPTSKLPIAKNLPAPPPPNFDRGANIPTLPPSNFNPQQPFADRLPTNNLPASDRQIQPTQPVRQNQPIAPTREQITAQRQQNLVASISELGKNLQKDEKNTSNESANKNYVDWLTKVRVAQPLVANIPGTYPKDACLRRLQGAATYGAVVDLQGNILETELIQSAGYPILNRQALRDINAQRFANQTGQLQPYRIKVSFDYNQQVCPSLGIPRSRNLEPSRESNNKLLPTPVPAPENNLLEKKSPLPTPAPENNLLEKKSPLPTPTPENNLLEKKSPL